MKKCFLALVLLLVTVLTAQAQSNQSISLTIENGQPSTFSINEYIETIHLEASGIVDFNGSLTLQAPEGCLMEVSGFLNGHGQPSTLSLGSGEYQQEFHTTDGIVEFEELFSHGNCLSLMLTAADFDMSADVQVYHPEKVSSEEKMRVFWTMVKGWCISNWLKI